MQQNRYAYAESNHHGSGHFHNHRSYAADSGGDLTDQEEEEEELELAEMNENTALASCQQDQVGNIVDNNNTINIPPNPLPILKRPNGLGFELMSNHNEMLIRDNNVNYLPSKSEVLLYFTQAEKFHIKKLNNDDMQITDPDGFPLLDAWLDVNLCYRFWRVEAYGRTVLTLREPLSIASDFGRPRVIISDWNGDFFGALSPGDPFLLLSAERQLVAKIVPHRSPSIEPSATSGADSQNPQQQQPSNSKQCWLCVLESTGRHIARLEDCQIIQFNKDVAFQLKLLTLAAIIRLVGHISPANSFAYVVKYMLNCCSGGT